MWFWPKEGERKKEREGESCLSLAGLSAWRNRELPAGLAYLCVWPVAQSSWDCVWLCVCRVARGTVKPRGQMCHTAHLVDLTNRATFAPGEREKPAGHRGPFRDELSHLSAWTGPPEQEAPHYEPHCEAHLCACFKASFNRPCLR